MASRTEEVALKFNQAVKDELLTKTEELKIEAILSLGAEINMLRVAIRTNSIDIEECINRITNESINVELRGK